MEFEPNCAGFALFHFGINPEEKYVDPKEVIWTDYFSEVRTASEADAVIVIRTYDYEEAELAHIAVLDARDKSIIHHRRKYGAQETTETLEALLAEFWNPVFDIIYVKLKT